MCLDCSKDCCLKRRWLKGLIDLLHTHVKRSEQHTHDQMHTSRHTQNLTHLLNRQLTVRPLVCREMKSRIAPFHPYTHTHTHTPAIYSTLDILVVTYPLSVPFVFSSLFICFFFSSCLLSFVVFTFFLSSCFSCLLFFFLLFSLGYSIFCGVFHQREAEKHSTGCSFQMSASE